MDSRGGLAHADTGSGGHVPINPEQYSRMKAAFERQGGIITRDPESDRYLDVRGGSALTRNAHDITFRSDREPTTTEVFEEFIHATQFRQGRAGVHNWLEMEIETAEKLIRNQRAYGIPDHEHIETVQNLERYRNLYEGAKAQRR